MATETGREALIGEVVEMAHELAKGGQFGFLALYIYAFGDYSPRELVEMIEGECKDPGTEMGEIWQLHADLQSDINWLAEQNDPNKDKGDD